MITIIEMDQTPDDLDCTFCSKPISEGDIVFIDDNGEISCQPCDEAEIKAQKEEGRPLSLIAEQE